MPRIALPIIALTAALMAFPMTAAAYDDNQTYPSWMEKSPSTDDDNDRYIFDRNRQDERIINDTRRGHDSNFNNSIGNGRSGNRTIGQSVTDQLKPSGR